MLPTSQSDAQLRQAAFDHVSRLAALNLGILNTADLAGGFSFGDEHIPLVNPQNAAFDAHLIGIDPDFGIHVSDRLLEIHDGPFLELGLKGIRGSQIALPRRSVDHPDRDRLALRFEQFKKSA